MTPIDALVGGADAIGLDEVAAGSALMTRTDRKYVLEPADIAALWCELGPWVRVPRLPLPCVPAALSVWQPAQWVEKRTAPLWLGSSSETAIPSSPNPQAASEMEARMARAMASAGRTRRASYWPTPVADARSPAGDPPGGPPGPLRTAPWCRPRAARGRG